MGALDFEPQSNKIIFPYFITLEVNMLAKRTAKNQLTLPKAVVQAVGEAEYYEVSVENGRIVLTPLRVQRADAVRSKLAELGVTENDVLDAISWARKRS